MSCLVSCVSYEEEDTCHAWYRVCHMRRRIHVMPGIVCGMPPIPLPSIPLPSIPLKAHGSRMSNPLRVSKSGTRD
jgi:hypothetical protein